MFRDKFWLTFALTIPTVIWWSAVERIIRLFADRNRPGSRRLTGATTISISPYGCGRQFGR